MSAGVRVNIVADASKFVAAMKRATDTTRTMHSHFRLVARAEFRIGLSPGERHIDRVCQEILAGKPGRDPAVRLIAAADFARVLDGQPGIAR